MGPSRRDHLRWLAALPLVSAAGRASASDTGPLVGTWSGMVEDATGRVQRFRLIVAADGRVDLQAIDPGLLDARATRVEVAVPAVRMDFASLGVVVRGTLVGRDRIDAVVAAEGETQRATLRRGDLYTAAAAELPPGPLTRDRLRALRRLSGAPAMGVGWASVGSPRTVMVDGRRSLGAPAPVAERDAWHLGSITKSMTATLAARLVEAGRIRWDATVGELLSPTVPDIRQEYRGATLIDLLSHHAGLPREPRKDAAVFTTGRPANVRAERLAYARLILAQPPVAPPRTAGNYSNAGYVVVGAMLERAMGAPWEALIAGHLFAPLGMRGAGLGPPATPGRVDAPVGHARRRDDRLHPWTNPAVADLPAVIGPAGLAHAPLGDLLAYLEAHRDRPARLLSRAGWDRLHTPPFSDGYALGWGVDANGRLAHGGSNGLWYADVSVDRRSGLVFAGALNAATPQAPSALRQASAAAALSVGPR